MMKFSIEEILKKEVSSEIVKFSVEEILKKGYKSRDSGNGSCSDSDAVSYSPRSMAPDSPNSDASLSDSSSDEVFVDAADSPLRKRLRTVIVRGQKQRLELFFQRSQYQSRLHLTKISRELGLPQSALKIWFQNRRAKYRKQGHKVLKQSEPESMSSDLSTSSPDNPEPIAQKSDDLLRRDSHVPCVLPCCAPKSPHVSANPYVCNCFSCIRERMRIVHESIRHRMYGRQNLEPFKNMEQFYAAMTVCCCSRCRLGTFYVQY
eukprot:Seg910.1 transcript_id=Seg910.1/GoldUCD/mRNA.D3Y31 product="Homeobox protein Mix.1" protein_id=Seg910.1/GoldUCD/D3Y31